MTSLEGFVGSSVEYGQGQGQKGENSQELLQKHRQSNERQIWAEAMSVVGDTKKINEHYLQGLDAPRIMSSIEIDRD